MFLFETCFYHTDFIAQWPCLKGTDVAPRDAKARHKVAKDTTSFIQQPHVQYKVQHTSLTILIVTENHV